jgi:uncharacterized protein
MYNMNMKLIDKISEDFTNAYKSKDMITKNFLGVIKTEVTKEDKNPEDSYVVAKIKSMIKNAEATNSLTDDEINILNRYLPTQLSEPELIVIISDEVKSNGYKGIGDMGKIMGFLKSNYDGAYDGKSASTIIKTVLTL